MAVSIHLFVGDQSGTATPDIYFTAINSTSYLEKGMESNNAQRSDTNRGDRTHGGVFNINHSKRLLHSSKPIDDASSDVEVETPVAD